MTTHTLTHEEIAVRKLMAYLKGRIVGHAVRKGMKWSSKREMTPEFEMGYNEGVAKPKHDTPWMDVLYREEITAIHVIHNRLRHDRPHTGSEEQDDAWLGKTSSGFDRRLQDVTQMFREQTEEQEVIA